MTDTSPLAIENALLRNALWLTVSALRIYHAAPHFEIEDNGTPKLEVIVPQNAQARATEALKRANEQLIERGHKR